MSSTPPPPHTPPPLHYPGNGERVGHRLRPVVIAAIIGVVILIAAAVTAAIVMTRTTHRPKLPPMQPISHAAMAVPAESAISRPANPPDQLARTPRTVHGMAVQLTSADPINVGQGISITPAPGWTRAGQGPNSVTLRNADSSAQMYVAVKPASGTDVVAVLQADINQFINTSSGGLVNVALGKPGTKTLQSKSFQQAANIDYIADVSTLQGATTVWGAFSELLNASNQLSAFIDFRETGDAPDQAATDDGIMIHSME
ncbi:hypothetical protein [Mycobacterium interjectum]|uniref:hypothetical protein n=1 Tax=Mycobacterium interjectum TaxID=33895 RepID=UPI00082FD33F|nr:hypothetical protein [Mycobacterium interjectum]MCV7090036.1 hypothetical protein [Mycobacterium interjectum]